MSAADGQEHAPPPAGSGATRPADGTGGAGRRPFGIFVSYRRDDSAGHTGRLFDKLTRRFGSRRVFMDVNAIQPGMDFRSAIDRALGSSSVVLAVIGRDWLEARDADGSQRLDSPTDLVRLEIAAALRQGMNVIPVLVQRASMPPADRLPEDIRALTWRHAIEIDDSRWDQDVERLLAAIDRTRSTNPSRAGAWPAARLARALGLVAAIAAGAIFLATQQSRPGPVAGGSASPSAAAPPAFETVLFADELEWPVDGLSSARTMDCQMDVGLGLSIAASTPNVVCDASTAAIDPAIVALQDVRVGAEITFTRVAEGADEFGPGDAALTCRTVGPAASGNYYLASLSPTGYWSIDRFVDGKQRRLGYAIDSTLITRVGQTRHLQFTCSGRPGETATLALAIDSRPVATVLNPSGLGPGSVTLAVTPYMKTTIAATFRNLEIRGP